MQRVARSLAPLAVAAVIFFACVTSGVAAADPRQVLIVTSAAGDAYGEALEGLRSDLKDCSVDTIDLSDATSSRQLESKLNDPGLDAIVSVGTNALASVAAQPSDVPVIATMVLRGDTGRASPLLVGRRPVAAVTLDVSLDQVLGHLKQLMPSRTRLGIILGSHYAGPAGPLLQAQAKQSGFTADVRECRRPGDLLKVFLSFRNQVDFVWCPPDASLFNRATVKALVLASVRGGLPIIGFSENFVRAGAAVAVYPDYQDVGRQTGDLVRRIIDGRTSALNSEAPATVRVAVNQRVLRVLGLRFASPAQLDNHFLILR